MQSTSSEAFLVALRRFRFGFLLAGLLLMLVYSPLLELIAPRLHQRSTNIVLGLVFGCLTISAVYAVSESRKAPRVAILLGIAALTTESAALAAEVSGDTPLPRSMHVVGHAFNMIFLCYIILVLLKSIFAKKCIDANTVFSSLCIYLLMGILWAFIYSLLEYAQAGSFSYSLVGDPKMRIGSGQTSLAIYFSFVTMTTLGYGDIVPISSAARALTTLQAVTGQLYLTVLVAWLVGLHIAHSRTDRSAEP